jgi:hypothetical protein
MCGIENPYLVLECNKDMVQDPGQHYRQCEEVGKYNELGCDSINESDLPNGYKQDLEDAKNRIIPRDELTNRTGEFMDGYILGYVV